MRLKFGFKNNKNNQASIRVGRTLEGTIFEVVTVALIVVMWIIALLIWRQSPESVPTHFGVDGSPKDWGSRHLILVMAAFGTLASALCLVCAYHPGKGVNLPVTISNPRQILFAMRLVRVMAVVCVLLFISIIFMMAWPNHKVPYGCMLTLIALMIVVTIYFCIRIYLARE